MSYEIFEIVMDRLEKEWFDLVRLVSVVCARSADQARRRRISLSPTSSCPQRTRHAQYATIQRARIPTQLSSVMAAISLCIKVRRRYTLTRPTAAHVAKIAMVYRIFQKVNGSAGSVPCRRKTLSYVFICIVAPVEAHVRQSCILCPNEGGAFKQTVQGEWVHLLCAIWVPETRVANDVFMEPVTGVDRISKQRWKLVRPQFCLDVIEFSTISSYQEMFRLRNTGRCMHPMH